jgi:hypothetical protein
VNWRNSCLLGVVFSDLTPRSIPSPPAINRSDRIGAASRGAPPTPCELSSFSTFRFNFSLDPSRAFLDLFSLLRSSDRSPPCGLVHDLCMQQ